MMDSQPSFIEEIDFKELEFLEVVGKGAFGVVSRALWRGKDVAVKRIETESERKAFMQELKQLSRVNHPNIVRLYGACREHPVCLVMEYAEGGSLYNVLHGSGQQPNYTAAHAMSWCLQCARGVEYLHSMKPKALVHRDLKPPNLLLIQGGTVLKICDFGTACDIQTHMTNNKGSAAWMAPEVFEGSNYSEKCDVFSWGIIFWEVLTRRKPFDEIGGPAFRIMWAVHNGRRPPPIQNLPKPLEILMTRCWSGKPHERPSMSEVSRIMTQMCQFFKGEDQPLVISRVQDEDDEDDMLSPAPFSITPPTVGMTVGSRVSTISDTLRHVHDMHHTPVAPVVIEETRKPRGGMSAPPSLAASQESLNDPRSSRSATPVDMSKRFSADFTKLDELDLSVNQPSPALNRVRGHRRSGSQGTTPAYAAIPASQAVSYPVPPPGSRTHRSGSVDQLSLQFLHPSACSPTPHIIITPTSPTPGMGHRRIGSDEYRRISPFASPLSINTGSPIHNAPPVHHSSTYPSQLTHLGQGHRMPGDGQSTSPPTRSISYQPPGREPASVSPRSISLCSDPYQPMLARQGHNNRAVIANLESTFFNDAYFSLEAHLQPIPPCPSSAESMQIFKEHCHLADEYITMQAAIAVLTQRKLELLKERDQEAERSLRKGAQLADLEEFTKLKGENESLLLFHRELKAQLDQYRSKAGDKRMN